MIILLFWFKVILKRIIELITISPVVTIGSIIIVSAFIYTNTNIQLTLDFNKFIITCVFLISIPIIISLKEYNVLWKITFYSKSNYSNRRLRYMFFIKKALLNNVFMILFFILVFLNRIILDFSYNGLNILFIFPVSVIASFFVIILRNNDQKIINKKKHKIYINPIKKSAISDYINSVPMAVIITAVSLFIGIGLFKDKNTVKKMAEPLFVPLILYTLLSIGFMGLLDAVINTNWLFYAIVSFDFRYHFKRSLIFIVSSYGIVLLQYIIFIMYIDMALLLIYLLAVVLTLLFSIGIVYLKGNTLKKIIIYVIGIRFAVYILLINPYLMLLSVFPLIVILFRAKSDFMEWGYL